MQSGVVASGGSIRHVKNQDVCQIKRLCSPTHGALPSGPYCSRSGLEGGSACKCFFALQLVAKPGRTDTEGKN